MEKLKAFYKKHDTKIQIGAAVVVAGLVGLYVGRRGGEVIRLDSVDYETEAGEIYTQLRVTTRNGVESFFDPTPVEVAA